jgi:peptide-methionine (S)-S-oxide reductase
MMIGISKPGNILIVSLSFLLLGFIPVTTLMAREKRMNQVQSEPVRPPAGREIATLAGGCFWCLEAIFNQLKGVEQVESGYSGGKTSNPSYRQVCSGATGHAEVVQVTFDPKVITFKELLQVFFTIHDPTTLNRQGPDVGTQYRSAIFYHSPEQQAIADQVIAELNAAHIWNARIVTEVTAFQVFYRAEDYHQRYYENNSYQPYCRAVIAPKVVKFRKEFLAKLRK